MGSLSHTATPRSKAKLDMSRLNERQQQAVRYAGSDALMILAAPGSGKTMTLTMRIAYLIDELCIPAASILAVTFTRNAGDEMKTRILKLLANSDSLSVRTLTFHQLCLWIIRSHYQRCEFLTSPKIVDKKTKKLIVENSLRFLKNSRLKQEECDWGEIGSKIHAELRKKAVKKQNQDEDADDSQHSDIDDDDDEADRNQLSSRTIDYFVNFIGKTKRRNESPAQYDSEHAFVLQAYTATLKSGQMIDLDDFIPVTVQLFQENPKILESYRRQWTHILVDEFQDVSPNQLELIIQLRGETGNLTVCGDEDQSIFGFRCGSSHTFKMLESLLPNIQTIILDQTYRSTPQIICAADSLIRFNSKRTVKMLTTKKDAGASVKVRFCYDHQAEIRDIITQILHHHNDMQTELSEIAVLCRVRNVLNAFPDAFRQANIPFEMVQDDSRRITNGKKLPKLTRRILAFCELIFLSDCTETQFHNAFFEVIKGTKGIGKKTIENIKEQLDGEKDILKTTSRLVLSSRQNVKQKLADFLSLIKTLRTQAKSLSAVQSIELIDSLAKCSTGNDNVQMKKLLNAAKEADARKLRLEAFCRQFKANQAASHDRNSDQPKNRVSLSTVHQAKGKEWECVFVVRFNEGTLPVENVMHQNGHNDNETLNNSSLDHYEEERRICYVALTRAKSHLYLSYVQYTHQGESVIPSRFFEELPKSIEFWEPKGEHKNLQRRFDSGDGSKVHLPYQKTLRKMQESQSESMWKVRSASGFQSATSLMSKSPDNQTNPKVNSPGFQSASLQLSKPPFNQPDCTTVSSTSQNASSMLVIDSGRQNLEMQPISQRAVDSKSISNEIPAGCGEVVVKHPPELGYVARSESQTPAFQYRRNPQQGIMQNRHLHGMEEAPSYTPNHLQNSYQSHLSTSVTANYIQRPSTSQVSYQMQHISRLCQSRGPLPPGTSVDFKYDDSVLNTSNVASGMRNQEFFVSPTAVSTSTSASLYSSGVYRSNLASFAQSRPDNGRYAGSNQDVASVFEDTKRSSQNFVSDSSPSFSGRQLPVPHPVYAVQQRHMPSEYANCFEHMPDCQSISSGIPVLAAQRHVAEFEVSRFDAKYEPATSKVEMRKEGKQFKRQFEAFGSGKVENVKMERHKVKCETSGPSKPHFKVEETQLKRAKIPQRSGFLSFTKPRMRSL